MIRPDHANVFVYVPYAPAVVEKYGNDDATGYPLCSGPTLPEGMQADEMPGLGLLPPSMDYPILQTCVC